MDRTLRDVRRSVRPFRENVDHRFAGRDEVVGDACVKAGITRGEVVHIDATLIHANVSWEAIAREHGERVLARNGDAPAPGNESRDGGAAECCPAPPKPRAVCTSDPDAERGALSQPTSSTPPPTASRA
jgi:hypothetical protein